MADQNSNQGQYPVSRYQNYQGQGGYQNGPYQNGGYQNGYQNGGYPGGYNNDPNAGHGAAVASLVLGIIGVVFWWFGASSIVSSLLGLIGVILASNAKKAGNREGIRTAGFVLSLFSLIVGSLIFIACVACTGALASLGALS